MKDEKTPRNEEGEPPTHDADETVERLAEKAQRQKGDANRARTEDKAREVGSSR